MLWILAGMTRRIRPHTPLEIRSGVLCVRHCAKFFTSALYFILRLYQVVTDLLQWLGNCLERPELELDLMFW